MCEGTALQTPFNHRKIPEQGAVCAAGCLPSLGIESIGARDLYFPASGIVMLELFTCWMSATPQRHPPSNLCHFKSSPIQGILFEQQGKAKSAPNHSPPNFMDTNPGHSAVTSVSQAPHVSCTSSGLKYHLLQDMALRSLLGLFPDSRITEGLSLFPLLPAISCQLPEILIIY